MASVSAVLRLRGLIAEPDPTVYSDQRLSSLLDAAESPEAVAYAIWTEKAAGYAELVDVSEAGSSRAMGDLHEQALAMSKHFHPYAPLAPGAKTFRPATTRKIIRI